MVDELVVIEVTGLTAGDEVKLVGDLGGWRSEAHFIAGSEGVVDPARDASVAGTYTGVEAMGLFWSMAQTGPGPNAGLGPLRVTITAEVGDAVIGTSELIRRQLAEGVRMAEVRDDGLFGALYEPPGPGPHPGLLVLGGSSGGRPEGQAAILASRGWAALALAYFNFESLPAALVECPLEYFGTAIDWMRRQPRIAEDRIGVVGESRGGELALLLGATFTSLRAVVAYVPSGLVWGAVSAVPLDPPRSAWSLAGKPVPFVVTDPEGDDRRRRRMAAMAANGIPYAGTPDFLEMLEEASNIDDATIRVERTNGPVFMISGEDDQMWPSRHLSEIAVARLRDSGHDSRYADEHLSYPGAGHLFSWPYYPTTTTTEVHAVAAVAVADGGNARDNARAWEDSWARVQAFLRTHL